jgi:hypothetical protein
MIFIPSRRPQADPMVLCCGDRLIRTLIANTVRSMPGVVSLLDQCANVVATHCGGLQLDCLPQEVQARVLHAVRVKGSDQSKG